MNLDRLALNALSRLESEQAKHQLPVRPKRGEQRTPPKRLPPGRHRVVVRTAPLPILLCDPLGRILETNTEGEAYTRWSKQALLRTTLHALIRADMRPAPTTRPDGGRVWRGLLARGDGSHVRVEVLEGRPVGGEEGVRPVFVRDEEVVRVNEATAAALAARLDDVSTRIQEEARGLRAGAPASDPTAAASLDRLRGLVDELRHLATGLRTPPEGAPPREAETK